MIQVLWVHAKELWSSAWWILDHRNWMNGKISSNSTVSADMIDIKEGWEFDWSSALQFKHKCRDLSDKVSAVTGEYLILVTLSISIHTPGFETFSVLFSSVLKECCCLLGEHTLVMVFYELLGKVLIFKHTCKAEVGNGQRMAVLFCSKFQNWFLICTGKNSNILKACSWKQNCHLWRETWALESWKRTHVSCWLGNSPEWHIGSSLCSIRIKAMLSFPNCARPGR